MTIGYGMVADRAFGQSGAIVVTGKTDGELRAPLIALVSNGAYPPELDVDLDEGYAIGDSLQIQGAADSAFTAPLLDVTVPLDQGAHEAIVAALGTIQAPAQTLFRVRGLRGGVPSPWSSLVKHGDTVPPKILSAATASFPENRPIAHRLVADEEVQWSILPSVDASRVELDDGHVIRLVGDARPRFDEKQSYAFVVKATDLAGNSTTQTLSFKITDVEDASASTWGIVIRSPYVTLDEARLKISSMIANVGAGSRVRATNARTGKRYFEMRIDAKSNDRNFIGLCSSAVNITGDYDAVGMKLGEGACLGADGRVYHNGMADITADLAFGARDVVMVAFDSATRLVWFGRNGRWHGNPLAGTGGFAMGQVADFYAFAAVCPTLGGQNGMTANFGAAPFAFPKPRGFLDYM